MDQQFSIGVEQHGQAVVLRTRGYINNEGGSTIAAECHARIKAGMNHVVLSLAESKVVNSIGMSYLLEVIEQLQENGGTLCFTDLDPAVEKMLTIMGIFTFAHKARTVDEAVGMHPHHPLASRQA